MAGRGELTEEAWSAIAPLLPKSDGRRGGQWRDHRTVINGILWKLRTGAPWRDLPERYGPWQTCADRLYRWRRDGTWDRILTHVQTRSDAVGEVIWEVSVDSSTARAHQNASGARRRPSQADIKKGVQHPSDEGLGRSRGGLTTKFHLACDGKGRPLAIVITPGQRHDSTQLEPVLASIHVPRPGGRGRPRTRPDRLIADKGYSYPRCRRLLQARQIAHTIPERHDQRAQRATRRGRPLIFDKTVYARLTWSSGASIGSNSGGAWRLATRSVPPITGRWSLLPLSSSGLSRDLSESPSERYTCRGLRVMEVAFQVNKPFHGVGKKADNSVDIHTGNGGRLNMPGSFLTRYLAGDSLGVWADLLALGPAIGTPEYAEDAQAVARTTMQRVRHNIEVIHARLLQLGYRFQEPDAALVPPPAATAALLEEIEHLVGPLPLSLRMFYEVVGSVDLRQSIDQISRKPWPARANEPELSILGDHDPLEVFPIQDLHKEACRRRTVAESAAPQLYFCWAADEYHKAHYSGGENYHVWLPDPAADFRIAGYYEIDQYFVAYLRASCASGGFCGTVEPWFDGDRGGQRIAPPGLTLIRPLAEDLESV